MSEIAMVQAPVKKDSMENTGIRFEAAAGGP